MSRGPRATTAPSIAKALSTTHCLFKSWKLSPSSNTLARKAVSSWGTSSAAEGAVPALARFAAARASA
eukprot:4657626-Lingulodinium_polyedra.AAC.1